MKNNDIIIRREEEKDYRETENLVREAFWNVYTDPELYFVADKTPKSSSNLTARSSKSRNLNCPVNCFNGETIFTRTNALPGKSRI